MDTVLSNRQANALLSFETGRDCYIGTLAADIQIVAAEFPGYVSVTPPNDRLAKIHVLATPRGIDAAHAVLARRFA